MKMPKTIAKRFTGKAVIADGIESGPYSFLLQATRPFRAWKKVWKTDHSGFTVIALTIPKGARFWAHSHIGKCRADRAISRGVGRSKHDEGFKYAQGKAMRVRGFSLSSAPCAAGIHFFATQGQARNYNWT